jgi:hypothetical protein
MCGAREEIRTPDLRITRTRSRSSGISVGAAGSQWVLLRRVLDQVLKLNGNRWSAADAAGGIAQLPLTVAGLIDVDLTPLHDLGF